MHGSILLVTNSQATPQISTLLWARGWGIINLKWSCPGGRRVGQMKIIFSLILQSLCYFSHGLHDGCGPQDYLFSTKNAEICQRVVGGE